MENQENSLLRSLEKQWTCPISKLPIQDPVVAADGYTYDRQFITQHLKISNTSPLTQHFLTSTDLVSNVNLKRLAEKIQLEIPALIFQEIASKIQISQLKDEIQDLKEELKHQKIRNDEMLEKEEGVIKTKMIEKSRHQDKNMQLRMIREQKNAFQQDLHQLRTKEQQQRRQFELVKQEFSSLKENFEKISRQKKEFEERSRIFRGNRNDLYQKVKQVFEAGLDLLENVFRSIQETKNYQNQMHEVENSKRQMNGQKLDIEQNMDGASMMDRWEQIFQNVMNGKRTNRSSRLDDEQNQQRDSFYLQQVKRVRFLMSKMPKYSKKYISSFYCYDKIILRSSFSSFEVGIKIDVMKSRIPFGQFLNFQWNQVKILDLGACNVDDELWKRLVEGSGRFSSVRSLNLQRNMIINVKMEDLEAFPRLVKFDIRGNNLSELSLQQLQRYTRQFPQVQVDYVIRQIQEENHLIDQDQNHFWDYHL